MGFGSVFRSIKKAVKEVTHAVTKTFTAPLKWAGKAFRWVGKKIGGDVGKIISGIGDVGVGLSNYINFYAEKVVSDVLDGNLKGLGRDILEVGSTAVIFIAAAYTGQWWMIASAITYADMKFGSGNIIAKPAVNIVTGFLADSGIVKNAREYRDEAYIALGIVAGMVAGFGAGAYIGTLGFSSNIVSAYNALNALYSGYLGYKSYRDYEELKENLNNSLRELENYYLQLEQEKKAANDLFLNQALNFSLYEWFAGGENYNMYSIGNSGYDYLNTKNPWFVILNESEEKAKNYEDLKPYLSYKSLNVYDDFFEKTLKIDNVFGVASVKKISNQDMYLNIANEYNLLVDKFHRIEDNKDQFIKSRINEHRKNKKMLSAFMEAIKDYGELTVPIEKSLTLKEKELKYYERYLH
ncbi:hypothetical protein AVCANL277_06610 [Campylobacter canadensis]|uniref:hypothetical protein n=1 Tax=Campylobacter canadensis TaxID=449520 RepID=UPI001CCCAA7C|nr:hypothetical protein [Campylobacter canadensis]MBZ8000532.1 hypothetical protein [Campylobacter canadensis]